MHSELTNLLPLERQRVLSRNYYLRLAVIALWFASALTFVSIVLLLPTYILLTDSALAKERYLATVESTLSSADGTTLSARLTSLNNAVTALATLAQAPSVSEIVRSILAMPRPGITLSTFVYTPPTSKAPGTVVISGMSASRDALRNYQLALEDAPWSKSAALPVSAYAKDRDITFSITITLVP